MPSPRLMLTVGLLLMAVAPPATAQETAIAPDSSHAQIRSVLRAFYLNLANQNWDALAAYVLSPKLLESPLELDAEWHHVPTDLPEERTYDLSFNRYPACLHVFPAAPILTFLDA